MGTRFGSRDFWDRLGGQVLTMIGRWYSRQPYKQNFYSHSFDLNTVALQISKEMLFEVIQNYRNQSQKSLPPKLVLTPLIVSGIEASSYMSELVRTSIPEKISKKKHKILCKLALTAVE